MPGAIMACRSGGGFIVHASFAAAAAYLFALACVFSSSASVCGVSCMCALVACFSSVCFYAVVADAPLVLLDDPLSAVVCELLFCFTPPLNSGI